MVQGGQRLGFAREALEAIRIRGEEIRQDLDGDIAVERRVLRAVDLAHPAGAELGNDFVRTDVGTRRKGHWNAAILTLVTHSPGAACSLPVGRTSGQEANLAHARDTFARLGA